MAVALVTVVSGRAYEQFARQLFVSANEFFKPQHDTELIMLPGREGWPAATLYRYHILREADLAHDYIYLVDADMKFVAHVGDEMLGKLVGTLHPGYVNVIPKILPFEDRVESAAWMRGTRYFCGGFVGGERDAFHGLAEEIIDLIEEDGRKGIIARWHDESYLNRAFCSFPPNVILSPSYCYPDDDRAYLRHWPERYERKLVALDKTAAERGDRSAA